MAMTGKLWTVLRTMEDERQETVFLARIRTVPIMLLTLLSATWMHFHSSAEATFGMIFAGAVVSAVLYGYLLSKVARHFKKEILPVLLQDIEPSLSYIVDSGIDLDEFNEPELFQRPDRYAGKDLIVGSIGQAEVKFSLVNAEEKRFLSNADSNALTASHSNYKAIFSGLFFIADFNKLFTGRTVVKPGTVDLFGKLFGTPVVLEDSVFNNMFMVYSTDQVEARYILTPSLMEKFKVLHAKVGAFQACFSHGRLFMAIDMPQNFFEPAMTRSLADSEQLQKIAANLRLITGIVEDLGLNVRNCGARTGS